jgi:hypothetical protein
LAIRVAPRAADLAGDLAGRFIVLVSGTRDAEAALAGLDEARRELLTLGSSGSAESAGNAPFVSPVVLSPQGPLLRVAELQGDEVLHSVPGIVADVLADAGVETGTVEIIEPAGPLDALDHTPDAVVLRVFPTPAGADGVLPARWLDLAAEWALGDSAPSELVALRLLGAPFTVTASDAPATLHAAGGARTWCDLVHGNLRDRVRSASITFGHAPHMALAAGGPGCDIPALLARFELLCELARDLQEGVAYACVDLEPTFEHIGAGLSAGGWRAHDGASPNALVGQVGDVAVPDAFPYQVLGPGHRARRAQLGLPSLGQPLEGGRTELELGDPVDWLPRYETRNEARELGWKELRGLLLTDTELATLVAERRGDGQPDPNDGPVPGSALRSGPDLDDIVLEALPHPRRGLHVTLLELASWIGHEAHSDAPRTVSPVLAAYARWLASGLDHDRRQALKPFAARLVGTRGQGLSSSSWRPLAPADDARAWMAADWLARVQAPTWLRLAGLDSLADRIARVRPTKGHKHAERLVRLLGTAIDTLSASPDGGPGPSAEEAAWDAWERASEGSGWVAASEAAWVGVPDELATSAELRVIELARNPAVARGSKDGGRTVAAGARAAALAAAAEAAWRGAATGAASAVDAVTRGHVNDISLATAGERAARGAAQRLGIDRDRVDVALEQADAAARDELARLIPLGPSRNGAALTLARKAAGGSAGGTVWTEVHELTQGVVGEAAWKAGLTAARIAVDRILQTAAPLVERATLVAVAREAAGLAARATAARSPGAALDRGQAELQRSALELLEALLAVE